MMVAIKQYRISLTINSLYYDKCLQFLLLCMKISDLQCRGTRKEVLVCEWEERVVVLGRCVGVVDGWWEGKYELLLTSRLS